MEEDKKEYKTVSCIGCGIKIEVLDVERKNENPDMCEICWAKHRNGCNLF